MTILIRPRVMAGVRDWWDKHVPPDPRYKADVKAATTPLVWWLPDGQLLETAPPVSDWRPDSGRSPTPDDLHYYYAMPMAAVHLEY